MAPLSFIRVNWRNLNKMFCAIHLGIMQILTTVWRSAVPFSPYH